MKIYPLVSLFAAAAFLGACSVEDVERPEEAPETGKELVFTGEFAGKETKTVLLPNASTVWWSRNDAISIYYGASEGSRFVATNDEDMFDKASFQGTLSLFTGEIESGEAESFWAVYPYDSAVSCDGSSVVATLPSVQTATAGSFANNTGVCIAQSPGMNLSFYNTISCFRFSVTKEGIQRVVFRGNNDEDIAGTFREYFGEDGKPVAPEVIDGKKEIVLEAPEGESLEVGKMYYIALFPQVFQQGFTVTFYTETEQGSRSINSSSTYLRARYNTGENFDRDILYQIYRTVLRYTSTGGSVYPNNTSTLDAPLDSFEYDESTGKGSLIFRGELTTIGEDSFAGCGTLKTITIPETVQTIGDLAFARCRNLESITIPEGVTAIGSRAFFNTGLTSITIPASVDDIGETVFGNCSKLASIVVNPGNEYYDSRNGCNALIEKSKNKLIVGCKNSIIPDTVTSIGDYAFQLLDGLTSITIPASVTSLGERVFYHCTGLTVVTFKSRNPPEGGEGLFAECYKLQESNNNNVHIYVPYSSSVNKFKEKASSWIFNSNILVASN